MHGATGEGEGSKMGREQGGQGGKEFPNPEIIQILDNFIVELSVYLYLVIVYVTRRAHA